jgi:aminoglycoside phosphotransferase (APT) family kinase protein
MSDNGDDQAYVERLIDDRALKAYLRDQLGPCDGFEVERHEEGHSNETIFVQWGETEYVLRRPPAGETADTAHDVLREYRIYSAVHETPVPVPTPVLACEDESVIGSEFYLMERVTGDVIRESEPDRFATPDYRRQIGETLVDTLVEIHTLDVEDAGLGDLGRPEGYLERQIDRWTKQFEWAFETTAETRPVPGFEQIRDFLYDSIPDNHRHTLVHGDYKLDNVMFGPGTPPEVVAVLDWELCTRGDPFIDLAWMLSFWPVPDPGPLGSLETVPDLRETTEFLNRSELVARYESQTGWTFENSDFYRTLTFYKNAAMCEMFYARYLNDDADDSTYPDMETVVPDLMQKAVEILEGDDTIV